MGMMVLTQWPPPDLWEEVIVTWETMLANADYAPNAILKWVHDQPGGQYHLSGYKSTEGFAFRFERPEDATMFRLRWHD